MNSDAAAPLPVAIEPEHDRYLVAAVEAGGGVVVPMSRAPFSTSRTARRMFS